MKYLKRLVVLALPLLAAISLGSPVSATPSPAPQLVAPGEENKISSPDSESRAAAALVSYIHNRSDSNGGVGTIRWLDGDYDDPRGFDAVLARGWRTNVAFGWQQAQAFYIGSERCANTWYWGGSNWVYSATVGAGTWYVPPTGQSVSGWMVQTFVC
ncbi:hypothetical protein ACWEPC_48800 [Nonomuraea sp. NPDC004297]